MNNIRISHYILTFFLMVGVVLLPAAAMADENQVLKNQVHALQQKVNELQKQLTGQTAQLAVQPAGAIIYDQWDPFEQIGAMENQMNRLMQGNSAAFNPREDIKQTPDAYIISMDIPGMEKNKINVEVRNGMLIISGDRNSEVKENKPNKYYLQERSFGHFFRTMALPDDARTNSIDAHYNNGVLKVKILRNKASNHGAGARKIQVK